MSDQIAVIGGGNLGKCIVQGFLSGKIYKPENILVTRRRLQYLEELSSKGVVVTPDNKEAVKNAGMILLCVKPHQAEEVLQELEPALNSEKHILISTVTGFSIKQIQEITGADLPVFRAMPNTAISLGESMTCLATENTNAGTKSQVEELFRNLGEFVYINEELMGSATVLAACGIAFALRFIRAAMQGGIEIGFGAELAQLIAAQTVKGASMLVTNSGNHPESEIDKVTTPRGITISGLNEMEHQGFSAALIQGLLNSYTKVKNL